VAGVVLRRMPRSGSTLVIFRSSPPNLCVS
jgi:hypothetical protein